MNLQRFFARSPSVILQWPDSMGFSAYRSRGMQDLEFSVDGTFLALQYGARGDTGIRPIDGVIAVWNTAQWSLLQHRFHGDGIGSCRMALLPDSRRIAVIKSHCVTIGDLISGSAVSFKGADIGLAEDQEFNTEGGCNSLCDWHKPLFTDDGKTMIIDVHIRGGSGYAALVDTTTAKMTRLAEGTKAIGLLRDRDYFFGCVRDAPGVPTFAVYSARTGDVLSRGLSLSDINARTPEGVTYSYTGRSLIVGGPTFGEMLGQVCWAAQRRRFLLFDRADSSRPYDTLPFVTLRDSKSGSHLCDLKLPTSPLLGPVRVVASSDLRSIAGGFHRSGSGGFHKRGEKECAVAVWQLSR